MSLICPECSGKTLSITARIELGPDARSDEVSMQIVSCSRCGFKGIALYEESRRGSLQDDTWTHNAYRAEAGALRMLRKHIRACPQPRNDKCDCPAHKLLRGCRKVGWEEILPEVNWEEPLHIGFSR